MTQTGSGINTFAVYDKLTLPLGVNLSDPNARTKTPSPGALAYDFSTNRLYYGDNSDWNLLDNGTGDVIGTTLSVDGTLPTYSGTNGLQIKNVTTISATGGYLLGVTGINGTPIGNYVSGPNSSVVDTLATYSDTSGKVIQDNTTITAIGGQLSGVTGINGTSIGTFGDVFGGNSSVVDTLATYSDTSGKIIKDNTTITAIGGQLSGVTGINGLPVGNYVSGPNSSVVNTLATYNDATGKVIQDGTTVTAIGGQLSGVTGINGTPIGNFGNVFGPGSSVDSTLATYSGTSGKIIQDATTITAIGGLLSGVTGINGTPIGNYVSGPVISVNNTLATYNGATGKIIQDNNTITAIGGQLSGVTGINGTPIGNFGNVFGPGSSVVNTLATYNDTTGKVIQDGTTITAIGGELSGVTGINGVPFSSIGTGNVVGPGSSVSGHVAGFTGTSGTVIYDMGITLSGNNTGDVTLGTFGSTPNANGASLAAQVLTLQPADLSTPGGVSSTTQTFSGVKTLNDGIIFGGALGGTLLNQYLRTALSLPVQINAITISTLVFVFERIGNIVSITFPRFSKIRANWTTVGGGWTTTIPGVPAGYYPASGNSYGQITTIYSERPSGGTVTSWIGYMQMDSTGTITIYPEFDTTGADDVGNFVNFMDGGTGTNNGWVQQAVSFLL